MQDKDFLSYVKPEQIGISSRDMSRFIDGLTSRGIRAHSIIGIRHDRIFLEAYFAPYKKERLHRQYSVSKSFVTGAIGLLADEGRIKLDDKVADYFPDMVDENTHPYILEATIRNLLMMASPHRGTTYDKEHDTDWVRTFFTKTPTHRPGTLFNYDTSATFILDVLVERLTGKPFLEYMKDKMLREMGFSESAHCIKSPDGYSWGGSGVLCTTMDLAKYALVFLHGGLYNGKRMLSEGFVREATSPMIPTASTRPSDAFIEGCGYGYYVWMTPFGSFSFLGMGDQLAICFPKEDMLIVMNCDTEGQGTLRTCIFELIDRYFLAPLVDALPSDDEAYDKLMKQIGNLSFPTYDGMPSSETEKKVGGRRYVIGENGTSISEFTLTFDDDGGYLSYVNPNGNKTLRFGRGKYILTEFPEYGYSGDTIGTPRGTGFDAAVAAVWTNESTLVIHIGVLDDYLGNMIMIFSFKGDDCSVKIDAFAEGLLEEYTCLRMAKAEK